MLILGVDVETTGLKPEDTIIELGMVLWSTNMKVPVKVYSEFIKDDKQPAITSFITKLTGINQQMVNSFGVSPKDAMFSFIELASRADYILAHNAPFDRGVIYKTIEGLGSVAPSFTWLDSQRDIVFPDDCKHKNLTFLGAYHGFVNPFPHRAVTDVLSMLKIADQYDWDEIVANAVSEKVKVRAICAKPWEDNKEVKDTDIAKEHGFKFVRSATGKGGSWEKEMAEDSFDKFNEKLQAAGIRAVRLKGQGNGQ